LRVEKNYFSVIAGDSPMRRGAKQSLWLILAEIASSRSLSRACRRTPRNDNFERFFSDFSL